MNKLKMLGVALCGALLGSGITYYVVKNKYEQILDEEIQSVKDTYKNRKGIDEEFISRKEQRESEYIENCDVENIASMDDIKTYNENKKDNIKTDYTKYHKQTTEIVDTKTITVVEENDIFIPPSLIDEEEVGNDGYDMKILTYYSDGKLTDDSDVILDIETHVGLDNIKLFDENPGCMSMFIRNERFGLDYEIIRDDMTWADFTTQMGIDYVHGNIRSDT